MTRRRPIDIGDTLLAPVRRTEHFRRTVAYLHRLRDLLVASGAGKHELATLDATAKDMASIVAMAEIFPPDTPQPRPTPELPPQPLVPPGCEWMHEWFGELIGDGS